MNQRRPRIPDSHLFRADPLPFFNRLGRF